MAPASNRPQLPLSNRIANGEQRSNLLLKEVVTFGSEEPIVSDGERKTGE